MAATPPARPAVTGVLVGALAVAIVASAATLGLPAVPAMEALPVMLVPWMLLLAGALGSRWRATGFVCSLLVAIGVGQLTAVALSAGAIVLQPGMPGTVLHLLSQLLFIASFAALVPLAAGYPGPRAPRWSWLAAAPLVLPLVAALSGPTPAVLGGRPLEPLAETLPAAIADWAAAVFALPIAAVAVGLARLLAGDAGLRSRLRWPLAALAVLAAVVALGAVTPEESRIVTDALFLVTAPLLPVALVAGAIVRTEPDAERMHRELAEIAAHVAAIGGRLERAAPTAAAPVPGLDSLTQRERDVLERIAQGRSNASIARDLHLSVSAVEKHTSAVFAKLAIEPSPDVHRRVAAAAAWHRAAGG